MKRFLGILIAGLAATSLCLAGDVQSVTFTLTSIGTGAVATATAVTNNASEGYVDAILIHPSNNGTGLATNLTVTIKAVANCGLSRTIYTASGITGDTTVYPTVQLNTYSGANTNFPGRFAISEGTVVVSAFNAGTATNCAAKVILIQGLP
jgi:hypothetical protein